MNKGKYTQWSDSCETSKEDALLALIERTGYNVTEENGMRKFGGPPPGWEGPPPPWGCEVFVGKIPRDIYEDELVPIFEQAGHIYEFRLMLELTGKNRGFGFVMYAKCESAKRAIQLFENFEIRPGKFLGVCMSLHNRRLFITPIPKTKTKEEIQQEMMKVTEGVVDVIVNSRETDKTNNRGFAFIEYQSHNAASMARRKLIPGSFQLWGRFIKIKWAKPHKEIDDAMQVRVLFVRKLMLNTTEETLHSEFSRVKPGSVKRVKKLTNFAFIHFYNLEDALVARESMNGKVIDGSPIEIYFAKQSRNKVNRRSAQRHGHNKLSGENYRGFRFLFQNDDDASSEFGTNSLCGGSYCFSMMQYALNSAYPFVPESALVPISPNTLKPNQLNSAVAKLDYYCQKIGWSLPDYHPFSLAGQDGKTFFVYKVVISSAWRSYMPDKVTPILEDAKELAAQCVLWNIVNGSVLAPYGSAFLHPGYPSPPYLGYPVTSEFQCPALLPKDCSSPSSHACR